MKRKKIDIYAAEIDRIKRVKGKLNAKVVVEEATNKDNPLHEYFEWDNNKCGAEWRLHRARVLINTIKYELLIPKGQKKKVYTYECIRTNSDSEYKSYYEIMANEKWRDQMIIQAVKELKYWREKYETYASKEFASLIKELKKVERRFIKNDRKGKKGKTKDNSSSLKEKRNKDKSKRD